MFYCYIHNWYSTDFQCPDCTQTVTTSGTTQPSKDELDKLSDKYGWDFKKSLNAKLTEPTELIPEESKEWTVMEYTCDYLGVSNERFVRSDLDEFKTTIPQRWNTVKEAALIHNNAKIYSVKRNSDNEVFTVGDEVAYEPKQKVWWKVDNFFIKDEVMLARSKDNINVEELNTIIKNHYKKESFTWDDFSVLELLSKYARNYNPANEKSWPDAIIKFKQSKSPSIEEKYPMPTSTHNSASIPESKDRIEERVNTDRWMLKEEVVGLLRDCVSETWGNKSIDETQMLFDQFLHKRKLFTPSKTYLNKFVSNKVNEILLDKKFTQQDLDKAIADAFRAARMAYTSSIKQPFEGVYQYPTINDYINSLKPINP